MDALMTFQQQLEEYPAIKQLLLTKPDPIVRLVNVAKKGAKKPQWIEVPQKPLTPPWRVYVRKTENTGWARKDFWTYKAAFDYFKIKRKVWYDVSITSKQVAFPVPGRWVKLKRGGKPLMVKTPTGMRQATRLVPIKPPAGHLWCMYCRRFTIFTWFRTHHAFNRGPLKDIMDQTKRRCCVCGITEEGGAWRR